MLERNGLRHGGFELREDASTWQDGRVRGMRWNADSEVLAIWIERADHDVGEFVCISLWGALLTGSATLDYEELPLLPQARDSLAQCQCKALQRLSLAR